MSEACKIAQKVVVMTKKCVTVVYDRKKEVLTKGYGKVEIRIYLSREVRKYVCVHTCDPFEWKVYQHSEELHNEIIIYEHVLNTMIKNGEEMTLENLDGHLGLNMTRNKEERDIRARKASKTGFIDFLIEMIAKEPIKEATMKRRRVTLAAIERYGKLKSFSDATPKNIKDFDTFLREEDPSRTLPTIHAYHKVLKRYTKMAAYYGYLPSDPYDHPMCKFERGRYKQRRPLTEEELLLLRETKFTGKEERVRDLFIFCAYTGLAYVDSQHFDYESMTETINGQTYIDGKRVKTGSEFFTPILPPAMKILKKYNYHLPHISNQKANDYLHIIQSRCMINKPLTMHVARHSFATLALSYDIPIEDVARMMGHTNIRTTQIYARILKKTIERHANALAAMIK